MKSADIPLARIVCCGDELLLGRVADGNGPWLAQRLADAGWRIGGIQVVGDAQSAIVQAIRDAQRDAALIIVCGGLGPTEDDRTRHALAEVAGVALRHDAQAWRWIRSWFRDRRPGLAVPVSNRRQALVPRGGRAVANPNGTAPGVAMRVGDAQVLLLPGPPSEMQAMWTQEAPALIADAGLRPPVIRELYLAGAGESEVQDALPGLFTEREPAVGITFSEDGHLTIRIVGRPRAVAAAARAIAPRVARWRLPAPGLAASVLQALSRRGKTIATAESCTAGQVAARLAAIPGASSVLRGGVVAYHADVKRGALGVPADLIARDGVVSESVAAIMAQGVLRTCCANWAIATTGLAGPGDGGTGLPVGTVCIAIAGPHTLRTRTVRIPGPRTRVQARAVNAALALLWECFSSR